MSKPKTGLTREPPLSQSQSILWLTCRNLSHICTMELGSTVTITQINQRCVQRRRIEQWDSSGTVNANEMDSRNRTIKDLVPICHNHVSGKDFLSFTVGETSDCDIASFGRAGPPPIPYYILGQCPPQTLDVILLKVSVKQAIPIPKENDCQGVVLSLDARDKSLRFHLKRSLAAIYFQLISASRYIIKKIDRKRKQSDGLLTFYSRKGRDHRHTYNTSKQGNICVTYGSVTFTSAKCSALHREAHRKHN